MGFTTSVVRYDGRGPWGDANYPGNTTGYLVKDFLEHFGARTVMDPMEGSGTVRDVCTEMCLEYKGYDLKDGHNILDPATQKLQLAEAPHLGYDAIFWHPPYYDMVRYNFGDDSKRLLDFSSGTYQMYLQRMQFAIVHLRKLMNGSNPRARMAVQIGDRRKDGNYQWIVADLFTRSRLSTARLKIDSIVIREQRGVASDNRDYATNSSLIRIMHEYLVLLEPV